MVLFSNGSVGGFTVLNTTASYPELVSGLVLVNASGQFDKPEIQKTEALEENLIQKMIFNPIRDWVRKVAIGFAYWQAKQPARIRSVLNNVSIPPCNHLILFLSYECVQLIHLIRYQVKSRSFACFIPFYRYILIKQMWTITL